MRDAKFQGKVFLHKDSYYEAQIIMGLELWGSVT